MRDNYTNDGRELNNYNKHARNGNQTEEQYVRDFGGVTKVKV